MNQGVWQNPDNGLNKKCIQMINGVFQDTGHLLENNVFGNIFFSSLNPNDKVCNSKPVEIAGHYGPVNYRLRLHLCLRNNQSYSINSNDVTSTWKENEILVLDDSYWHRVNSSTERESWGSRDILIIDIWKPRINTSARAAINLLTDSILLKK